MKSKVIDYYHENVKCEGYLVYNENISIPQPTILVVHDWSGRGEFAIKKAEYIAKLGYVGFAIDMYGNGQIGSNVKENEKLMQGILSDRRKLQSRILSAYHAVLNEEIIDKNNIGVIGFCFGGLCALDLVRSGVALKGAISFHGFLHGDETLPNKPIQTKILVLHGQKDPMVDNKNIQSFIKEFSEKKVDWQFHSFGDAYHAFMNPKANYPDLGTIYSAKAEKRSLIMMKNFFEECIS